METVDVWAYLANVALCLVRNNHSLTRATFMTDGSAKATS